jgi:hypothetical protein
VAGSLMGACSNDVTGGGNGGGGTGGTTTSSSSATTTSTTTTTDTNDTCDPGCLSPSCLTGEELTATGTVDGSTLTISFGTVWEEYCFEGWPSDPVVVVDAELGTLGDVTTDATGGVVITIQLADGATGGTVSVELALQVEQATSCSVSTTVDCALTRAFEVTLSDAGAPQIARRSDSPAPTLERRPPMKLTLAESHGTEATVRVSGVPADVPLRFVVSEGTLAADGTTARWHLPERPGLYQVQVVAERDGLVAVDQLVLEVRG